ncbi:hypothetical protein [Nocardiopsis sp. CC223A]|uniref:hypothetical protein n=1 Tax=Nocardiopsis sp. CC223A TaxID=3044051 RepID=UPI00278C1BBD|nr:hypothetical protein [Nocardiopsis sp. CC223A]
MTALALTMVPQHQIPPRPSPRAQQALRDMELALVSLGYTPCTDLGEWVIDARVYPERTWRQGRPVGIGAPSAAVRVLLHQPEETGLWWLIEYPARLTGAPATGHHRLAVLGDATRSLHSQDLGLLDHLITRARGGGG